MGVLGANFKVPSFLSIDAVGPGSLESIIRVDPWLHLPKMARLFVDKLETKSSLNLHSRPLGCFSPKVRDDRVGTDLRMLRILHGRYRWPYNFVCIS